ncbi:arrestin domain-containing protein 1b isoform X2 [Periophthalmus magnuspinnatus]|uniref:arrestin domain-containing protein 1b isoform X2 n=1 Tax=Periophthalmus magnuspinnatus TaxID=409849 RepID=UPI0024371C00|nr:arrestin domain-containing protein 1b isoform X2 [Periophthalmus magnuspinnatus]
MGKLQEFDITFTNNKVVYSPGESITGTLKIRTANSLQYKAIKVNCQGSCGISNKMNDAAWAVEEQYFNSTLSVADKAAVPTSFEGPFGKIVYRIKAAIDTPRFSKDYKAQRQFYLLNLLNLNHVSGVEHPSYAVVTKKFNYLLVKTGTLMLKARSDLRGYIPGQVIRLSTEIHNKSGRDTGCVLASLIQKVTYRTKRPVMDLRTIAEVEGAGVKAGKHAEWREQIIVPPLPQSELAGCSLIHIDYFIQVSLKSPDTVVTLPIHIGNIAVNLSPTRVPDPVPSSPVGVAPSAPPCEDNLGDLCAGGVANEEIPTKSHSQQDPSGQPVTMLPGAALPPAGLYPDLSAQLFCLSTGATIPFFTEGSDITPIPTSCSLILPPEYSSWDFPQEPPPTYEESCSTANSTPVNSRQ